MPGAGRPSPGADSRTMILTPEEYANGPGLSGFPFKPPRSSFNTDMFRAEP